MSLERTPVVGEIWTFKASNLVKARILAVADEGVLFDYSSPTSFSTIAGRELDRFVQQYNPPPPPIPWHTNVAPGYWVVTKDGQGTGWGWLGGLGGPFRTPEEAAEHARQPVYNGRGFIIKVADPS